jgi:hypothetical protein
VTRPRTGHPGKHGSVTAKHKRLALLHVFQMGPGAHTAPYGMDTGIVSPGGKVLRHEAGHTLHSTARYNEWNYTPILPYAFMACMCNFTVTTQCCPYSFKSFRGLSIAGLRNSCNCVI